jgi:hypothetical protein
MVDNTRGGPPSRDRKPGGGGPGEGGPGGRGGGDRRGPGGPRKGGGKGGFGKGPAKPVRVETYESLKELTRGEGFRIDKFVVAEKGTHRPVKTEYRLTREGLKGTAAYPRLVDAQAAAIAPLPEPEPEPIEEAVVEAAPEGDAEATGEGDAAGEAPEHDEGAMAQEAAHSTPEDQQDSVVVEHPSAS